MSTFINVTVGDSLLVDKSKQNQQSNRSSFVVESQDKQTEERAREELARQQAQQQLLRDGAVPEYQTQEQTSAQRGGPSFGIGWMYESYIDALEHTWAENEEFRIAVGSGDGTKWAYVDLVQPIPADKPPASLQGFYQFSRPGQELLVDTVSFTYPLTVNPPGGQPVGCASSYTVVHERKAQWQRLYDLDRHNIPFIIPIGGSPDAGCIVVGCARIKGEVYKEYSNIPIGTIPQVGAQWSRLTGGFFPTYADVVEVIEVNNPSQGTLVSYSVRLSGNSYCNFASPYNYAGFNGTATSNYGQPSYTYAYRLGFVAPATEVTFSETTRVNYAFFVSTNQCRRLNVSEKLNAALEEWLPTDDDYAWNDARNSSTDGPAWGRVYDTAYIGQVIYGSPGIFDIIRDDYNFLYFDYPLQSEVTSQIPITAPDLTTVDSAFSYAAQLEEAGLQTIVNYPAPPGWGSGSTPLYLNAYTLLNPSQRTASAYYSASSFSAKSIISGIQNDPQFWLWSKKNNPGGIQINTESYLPTLAPDGPYKTAAKLKLSPNRELPPALFNESDTTHPLIIPQVTRSQLGLTNFGNIFFPATKLVYPWSPFRFYTLLWTDWGAGRQTSRLAEVGAVLSSYTQPS